jgi:FixJ family two-component response regulator
MPPPYEFAVAAPGRRVYAQIGYCKSPMVGMSGRRAEHCLIAVIDDDISFREALAGLIKSLGYPTAAYASADEFLRAPPDPAPSCLVVDINMPGMSGFELHARLAASGPSAPVIFMTSALDDRTAARAMSAGAVGVLGKPFDREELIARLEQALDLPRGQDRP